MPESRDRRAAMVVVAAVAAASIIRTLVSTVPAFNAEEAVFAVTADQILDGRLPYRDVVFHRPPGIAYLYAAIFSLFGRWHMTAVHVVLTIIIALTAALVFQIGRRIRDRWTGGFAAVLFTASSVLGLTPHTLALTPGWCAAFLSTLGVWMLLRGLSGKLRLWFLASGVAFGAAMWTHQPALFDVIAALVGLWLMHQAARQDRSGWLEAAALLIIGTAAAVAGMAALLAHAGILAPAWQEWSRGRTAYDLLPASWTKRLLTGVFLRHQFFRDHLLLLVLGLTGAWLTWSERSRSGRSALARYVGTWAALAYLGAAWSGWDIGEDFLPLLPPFCLLSGYALRACLMDLRAISTDTRIADRGFRVSLLQRFLVVLCGVGIVLPLAPEVTWRLNLPTYVGRGPVLYAYPVSGPYRDLVADIAAGSRADERLFVWGWAPELYLYAQRKPASRYLVTPPLSSQPGDEAGERLAQELAQAHPRYIIVAGSDERCLFRHFWYADPDTVPPIRRLLQERYVVERTIPASAGWPVLRVFKRRAA